MTEFAGCVERKGCTAKTHLTTCPEHPDYRRPAKLLAFPAPKLTARQRRRIRKRGNPAHDASLVRVACEGCGRVQANTRGACLCGCELAAYV